jgi:hypothetical protein
MSFAGAAGTFAGISVVQYRRQAPLMTNVEAQVSHPIFNSRKKVMMIPRKSTFSRLPTIWGMACFTFCGIVELTRLSETSKLVLSQPATAYLLGININTVNPIFYVWSDYTLGGAMAGAFFRGVQLNAGRKQRTSPFSVIKPSIARGLFSGAALGFLLGAVQSAAAYMETVNQSKRTKGRETDA